MLSYTTYKSGMDYSSVSVRSYIWGHSLYNDDLASHCKMQAKKFQRWKRSVDDDVTKNKLGSTMNDARVSRLTSCN
jgi:hypothetical protein